MTDIILLTALIFAAAVLYSSVGHAGASGYLAAGALLGFPQSLMRPAALLLNIFVASIGTFRFWRARLIQWQLLWPFAITSMPLAFVGGRWKLSDPMYQMLLGCVLALAALNLLAQATIARRKSTGKIGPPPLPVALGVGAGIGLLAGMTGVGGGIFLSPILVLARWADPRQTAAVSAPFILINSVAGIAGQMRSGQFHPLQTLPLHFLLWAAAAVVGGMIGSYYGARKLSNPLLRILLAVVLLIAGLKLIFA